MPESMIDDRLTSLFAAEPGAAAIARIDARIAAAIAQAASPPRRFPIGTRHRRRRTAIIALAAVLATVAATPVLRDAFESWSEQDFESVWDRATPIGLSVEDDSYRVTIVRAYADAAGLYLAVVGEDLDDPAAGVVFTSPTVVDDDGHEYPMFTALNEPRPDTTASESFMRFHVPPGAAQSAVRALTVTFDHAVVPGPMPVDDEASGWQPTTVAGDWTVRFDLPFEGAVATSPQVMANAGGVDVTWESLAVTPSATIVELRIDGLPPRPADWDWEPILSAEHNGKPLELYWMSPVDSSGSGRLRFEAYDGADDLAGPWTVTIEDFRRDVPDPGSDISTGSEVITGPWVLEYPGESGG